MIHYDSFRKLLYTAKTHTTGGRGGAATRTFDRHLDVKLLAPGTAGSGTNPEQLLAAGWSAGFLRAMKLMGVQMKVALPARVAIDPEVDLGSGGAGHALAARVNVSLPGVDREVAQHLLEAAHQVCPYSRATHGNIENATNLV
jgi:osmotically inducible protein OsmC